jgi:hypothetical protein
MKAAVQVDIRTSPFLTTQYFADIINDALSYMSSKNIIVAKDNDNLLFEIGHRSATQIFNLSLQEPVKYNLVKEAPFRRLKIWPLQPGVALMK